MGTRPQLIVNNQRIGANSQVNVFLHMLSDESVTYVNGVEFHLNHGRYVQFNRDMSRFLYGFKTLRMPVSGPQGIFYGTTTVLNKVKDMHEAFSGCGNLTGGAVVPYAVENMYRAYYNCGNIEGLTVYSIVGGLFGESPNSLPYLSNMYQAFYNCVNFNGTAVSGPNCTNMDFAYYNTRCTRALSGAGVVYMRDTYKDVYFDYYDLNYNRSADCGPNVVEANNAYMNTRGIKYLTLGPNVVNAVNMYRNSVTGSASATSGQVLNLESLNNCNLVNGQNAFYDSGISHSIIIHANNLAYARGMFYSSVSSANISNWGRTIWWDTPNLRDMTTSVPSGLDLKNEYVVIITNYNKNFANWYLTNGYSPMAGCLGGFPNKYQSNRTLIVSDQNLYNTLLNNAMVPFGSSYSMQHYNYDTVYQFTVNLKYSNGSVYKTMYLNSNRRIVSVDAIMPWRILYVPDLENASFLRELDINLNELSK